VLRRNEILISLPGFYGSSSAIKQEDNDEEVLEQIAIS
jgi:hypothetical protein